MSCLSTTALGSTPCQIGGVDFAGGTFFNEFKAGLFILLLVPLHLHSVYFLGFAILVLDLPN